MNQAESAQIQEQTPAVPKTVSEEKSEESSETILETESMTDFDGEDSESGLDDSENPETQTEHSRMKEKADETSSSAQSDASSEDSFMEEESSEDAADDSTADSKDDSSQKPQQNPEDSPEAEDDRPMLPETAPETEEQKSLEDELTSVRSQLESKKKDKAALEKEISTLNSTISSLEKHFQSMQNAQSSFSQSRENPVARKAQGTTPNLHVLRIEFADLELSVLRGSSDQNTEKRLEDLRKTFLSLETVSVYRLYNPNSGEHFYTPDGNEKEVLKKLGWKYEGVGWRSPKNNTSQPVYRLYNPNAGDHHYTTDSNERNVLKSKGWNDEGIGWYSDPYQGVAILRAYNPNAKAGAHHFTEDEIEWSILGDMGWKKENVGFYARTQYSVCGPQGNDSAPAVWYDDNDVKFSGEKQLNGYWYYFAPQSGSPVTGLFTTPGTDRTRLYGADGRHLWGPQNTNGAWRDFDHGTGLMVRNRTMRYGDGTVRFYGGDGTAKTGSFSYANVSFTADGNGNILTTRLAGVPLYMQTDLRWAGVPINGLYFRGTGCLPTVVASMVTAASGQTVSPIDLGRWYGQERLMNAGFLGTRSLAVPKTAERYSITCEGDLSEKQIEQILRAGGVVCTTVNSGPYCPPGYDHEVLLMNYENGKAYIHDPIGYGADGWYPISLIASQESGGEYVDEFGGPTYGFLNKRMS